MSKGLHARVVALEVLRGRQRVEAVVVDEAEGETAEAIIAARWPDGVPDGVAVIAVRLTDEPQAHLA
ncbi:MAG: hypothetical protein RLZZ187_2151 [Pseudomonadota bacterium]|jgi:hypothetical protein